VRNKNNKNKTRVADIKSKFSGCSLDQTNTIPTAVNNNVLSLYGIYR